MGLSFIHLQYKKDQINNKRDSSPFRTDTEDTEMVANFHFWELIYQLKEPVIKKYITG